MGMTNGSQVDGRVNQIGQLVATPTNLISRLQLEADKNECFRSICDMLAMRERSRRVLTLKALMTQMANDGHNYTKNDYTRVLRFLANSGIAELHTDNLGDVIGLVNIKIALQAIAITSLEKQTKSARLAGRLAHGPIRPARTLSPTPPRTR